MYKMAFWIVLVCLAVAMYEKYKPHDEWFPDVDSNRIICYHYGWSHKTETVLHWRRDSDGEPGWCYQGKDGLWYAFRNDEY